MNFPRTVQIEAIDKWLVPQEREVIAAKSRVLAAMMLCDPETSAAWRPRVRRDRDAWISMSENASGHSCFAGGEDQNEYCEIMGKNSRKVACYSVLKGVISIYH
jgi:hypothetical protein